MAVLKLDAVVTAGGRIDGAFAERTGVSVKALIEIGGRPVIAWVLEALRGVPEVGRIIVIGPEELRSSTALDLADEIIPEAPDGATNFMLGLERCKAGDRALFCASDLPFITLDAVRWMIEMCGDGGDFCYPILRKEQFKAAYPGSKILYAPLKDGWYTGGCVFVVNPQALLNNRSMIERVFSARRSLFKLASILGFSFVVRLAARRARIEDCVRRGSELIGCDCRVVPNSPPELVYDLDYLRDYEYAVAHAERAPG